MTLADRLSLLVAAFGSDVKSLQTNSATMSINAATRLIQTQRIIAQQVLRSSAS